MQSVETWVIQALTTPDDEGDPHIVKVTCRLDAPDVVDLDHLAKRLNMSRTAAATGLLTAAITQAWSAVRFYDENPYQLDEDERQMHEDRQILEHQQSRDREIALEGIAQNQAKALQQAADRDRVHQEATK